MTRGKKIKKDPFLIAVCEAVHSRRSLLGISQEELAERSGLHRTYISDIERGARNPTLKTLSRLAVALEMSASQLVLLAEAVNPALARALTADSNGHEGKVAEPYSESSLSNGDSNGHTEFEDE